MSDYSDYDYSDYLEGPQFSSTFPEGPAIEVRAPVLKELLRTRIQLLGAPHLQEPADGSGLQVLSDKEWVNWTLVEDILTKRLRDELNSGTPLGSVQLGLLASSGWGVGVLIEYLVDDYWLVVCLMPVMEDYEEWESHIMRGSAAAVLRIGGSGSNLTDTSEIPVWFTAAG